jgi:hypothetical protein
MNSVVKLSSNCKCIMVMVNEIKILAGKNDECHVLMLTHAMSIMNNARKCIFWRGKKTHATC